VCGIGGGTSAGFWILTIVPEVPLVYERGWAELGEQVGPHLLAASWRSSGGRIGGGDGRKIFGLEIWSKRHYSRSFSSGIELVGSEGGVGGKV